MLPLIAQGKEGPQIVMLHWLGGSARSWAGVSAGLAETGARTYALDLPGFGDAATMTTFFVGAVVEEVIESVRSLRRESSGVPWLLAGHSMGGKLAAIIARAAADGAEGLEDLRGLILISPSPSSPEPMKESKRVELLETLGASTRDGAKDRKHAGDFVDDNTGKLALDAAVRESAIEDLLRMNRDAFRAWLTDGSKEDWSDRVGVLSLPVLLLAGSEEKDLGPAAQEKVALPHMPFATLIALAGGGHLAPLERAAEFVDRVAAFARKIGCPLTAVHAQFPSDFRALIDSEKTSPQTRHVMETRLVQDDEGSALTDEEALTLRALVRRIVPGAAFDVAARMQTQLAKGSQDGWRFDVLPADAEAWKMGLASLDAAAKSAYGVPFSALDASRQNALLVLARDGKLGHGLLGIFSKTFDAAQMKSWFEDVRSDIAKTYVADPRTMQRMGFEGFADDAGFTQIRLEQQEMS